MSPCCCSDYCKASGFHGIIFCVFKHGAVIVLVIYIFLIMAAAGTSTWTSQDQEMINALVEEEIQLRRYGNLSEGSFAARQQLQSTETQPWEADRASLQLIQASLKKTDILTTKMVRSG